MMALFREKGRRSRLTSRNIGRCCQTLTTACTVVQVQWAACLARLLGPCLAILAMCLGRRQPFLFDKLKINLVINSLSNFHFPPRGFHGNSFSNGPRCIGEFPMISRTLTVPLGVRRVIFWRRRWRLFVVVLSFSACFLSWPDNKVGPEFRRRKAEESKTSPNALPLSASHSWCDNDSPKPVHTTKLG